MIFLASKILWCVCLILFYFVLLYFKYTVLGVGSKIFDVWGLQVQPIWSQAPRDPPQNTAEAIIKVLALL